jgi:hypothetical protein
MRYKFNNHPEDCRYIVNEDKRKVICIIEDTDRIFINFANNNFKIPYDCTDTYFGDKNNLFPKLLMPKRFWGIATCSEDDEWDEETGKKVAFSKAKDKLNKSFVKRANLYVHTFDRYLDRAVEMLNDVCGKLNASTEHRHNKLDTLLGETDVVSED